MASVCLWVWKQMHGIAQPKRAQRQACMEEFDCLGDGVELLESDP